MSRSFIVSIIIILCLSNFLLILGSFQQNNDFKNYTSDWFDLEHDFAPESGPTPNHLLDPKQNEPFNTLPSTRGSSREFSQRFSSEVIEMRSDEVVESNKFLLQKNSTILDAKIKLKGLPSFDFKTWDNLTSITDHINDGLSQAPVISVDKYGGSHVVWEDNGLIDGFSDWDIIYAQKNKNTWNPDKFELISVADPISQSRSPDMAVDEFNEVHFVWVDKVNYSNNGKDRDIFYRNRKLDVPSWSAIRVISDDEVGFGDSINPKIEVNKSGDIFIVWQDNENNLTGSSDFDILLRVWYKNNNTWSSTIILSDDINLNESQSPDIASDGDHVFVTWVDNGAISGSGNDTDIIMRKWNGLKWEGPIVISNHTQDGASTNPSIDAHSGVIGIVWEETGDINNSGSDKDIILKKLQNFKWESYIISENEKLSESTYPDIDIDREKNIHIAWSDDVDIKGADKDTDIFYRRWERVTKIWTDYILISGDPSSWNSITPELVVNDDARVEIVWMDDGDINGNGPDPDIMYRASKFIYPSNLKLIITCANDSVTINSTVMENGPDWYYDTKLNNSVSITETWLKDKLNLIIKNMNSSEKDCLFLFKSDTNGSLKISDFELLITSTPERPNGLHIIGEEYSHVLSDTPFLSWNFFDNDSFEQGEFEVQVGSTPGSDDMWSYGPISSSTEFTKYNGKPLLDGQTYYFRVRVKDSTGATSDWSINQNFTMNARPEIVSLTPVSGIVDEFVDIEWQGTDKNDDKLLYTVQVHYDGEWHRVPELEDTNLTKYRFNTSTLTQSFDVKCRCFDGYEYSDDWYNEDGSITIIHNKPPSILLITPQKGNTKVNDSYIIQWTSYDPDFDDNLTISIYYVNEANLTDMTLIVTDYPDIGSYHWNTSKVSPGKYFIYILISDGKSNSGKYSEGMITIDHTIDTNPPKIVEIHPKSNSQNVSLQGEIFVRFNKHMDITTLLTPEFFYVKDSLNRIVEGYIQYDSSRYKMIFYPYRYNLDYGQVYTITVKAGVKDISGNLLDGNGDNIQQNSPIDDYIWTFSTRPRGVDVSPPYILSVNPKNQESGINIRPIISTIFSENLTFESVNQSTIFIIDSQRNFVDGEIYFIPDLKELRISFYKDLKFDTKYTIFITAEVRDLLGNGLDGNKNGISQGSPVDDYTWSFTTKSAETPKDNGDQTDNLGTLYLGSLIIIGLIILLIIVGLFYKKRFKDHDFIIHDIFVIYNDGRLLAHQSFEKKSNVDEGSMGGMLTAIQNFINESFFDHDDEVLEEIKYGKLKIYLVHGSDIYLAIICSGDVISARLEKDMKKVLTLIEIKFSDELNNWDGNMKKVRDIGDLIKF
jgi:hypothetical protein